MSENNSIKQIKYGSIISYILILLNILLGLIYTPWILREIGSSNYGLYTLASTLISLLLMDFGMSAAITRFAAKYRAENRQDKINSFVGLAIKFYFGLMFIISVLLIVVYFKLEMIYKNLTTSELEIFKIVFIITAFFLIICFPVNICRGILNAYEHFIVLKGADIFNKLGTVLFTIIVLLAHGGIYGLVFVNGLFNLITFIFYTVYIKKELPIVIDFKNSSAKDIKEILGFTAWTTVHSISQQAIFNLIPSVLAMVANTFSITLYGFANVIEGYVYNITSAINGLFLPRISEIVVNQDDAKDTLPLMIKVGRINHSITMLLLMGLTLLGREFVDLWVGQEYEDLYYCILLLSYPYFISASQQIAYNSIVALNKVKYTALANLISGVVNLIGAYLIAGRYGIVGVCAVTFSVFIFRIVIYNYIYAKILKIKICSFFGQCHIKLLFPLILSGTISSMILHLPIFDNIYNGFVGWGLFSLKIIIICIVYFIVMWTIGWNKFEKNLLMTFRCRRIRQ